MMRIIQTCSLIGLFVSQGCDSGMEPGESVVPKPTEFIDLGVLITADTPQKFWGTKLLKDLEFTEPNSFRIIHWDFGAVSGSNGYYTLFNHGGPHVDAPNHVSLGQGVDSYSIESFAGPLKVFDFSHLEIGRTITVDMLAQHDIVAGDIVVIYTGYVAPTSDSEWPAAVAPTYEAAKYLASIPVRAFGTDAFNVESLTDQSPVATDNEIAATLPGHHAFLSHGIPLYEQLANVDKLLDKDNMYFVGVPLNVKDGDGMIVRPVVFVY